MRVSTARSGHPGTVPSLLACDRVRRADLLRRHHGTSPIMGATGYRTDGRTSWRALSAQWHQAVCQRRGRATHFIVAVRTGPALDATSLLVIDKRAGGVSARLLAGFVGWQAEVTLNNVRIPADALLGRV